MKVLRKQHPKWTRISKLVLTPKLIMTVEQQTKSKETTTKKTEIG